MVNDHLREAGVVGHEVLDVPVDERGGLTVEASDERPAVVLPGVTLGVGHRRHVRGGSVDGALDALAGRGVVRVVTTARTVSVDVPGAATGGKGQEGGCRSDEDDVPSFHDISLSPCWHNPTVTTATVGSVHSEGRLVVAVRPALAHAGGHGDDHGAEGLRLDDLVDVLLLGGRGHRQKRVQRHVGAILGHVLGQPHESGRADGRADVSLRPGVAERLTQQTAALVGDQPTLDLGVVLPFQVPEPVGERLVQRTSAAVVRVHRGDDPQVVRTGDDLGHEAVAGDLDGLGPVGEGTAPVAHRVERGRDALGHHVDLVQVEDPADASGHVGQPWEADDALGAALIDPDRRLSEQVEVGDPVGGREREHRQGLVEAHLHADHHGHDLHQHGLATLGVSDEQHVLTALPHLDQVLDVGLAVLHGAGDVTLHHLGIGPERIEPRVVQREDGALLVRLLHQRALRCGHRSFLRSGSEPSVQPPMPNTNLCCENFVVMRVVYATVACRLTTMARTPQGQTAQERKRLSKVEREIREQHKRARERLDAVRTRQLTDQDILRRNAIITGLLPRIQTAIDAWANKRVPMSVDLDADHFTAMTDFKKITLSIPEGDVSLDFVGDLRGLAYHEAGHILRTIPLPDLIAAVDESDPQRMTWRINEWLVDTHGLTLYQVQPAWNIIEDQRMETGMVRRSKNLASYYNVIVLTHVLAEGINETSHL